MIGTIKVLHVAGRNYPLSDKLFDVLQDKELADEVTKIVEDAGKAGKAKKSGKKEK